MATELIRGANNFHSLLDKPIKLETSSKIKISLIASLEMTLSIKRITKSLIRLRVCAGLSTPLLFANT